MIPAETHPDTLAAASTNPPAAAAVVAQAKAPAPRIDSTAPATTRQTVSAATGAASTADPQVRQDRITAAPAALHSDSTRGKAAGQQVQPGRTTATPPTTAATSPHVPAAQTAPGTRQAQPRLRQADRALPSSAAPSERSTTDTAVLSTVERDSLPFPLFGTADSLRNRLAETSYREVPAETVFGAASSRASLRSLPSAPEPSLTANPVFQSFVLLLAAAYALLLYHHLGDIRTLMSRISRDRAAGDRLSEDTGGSTLARFLHISAAIGLLFIGVVTVRYGDSLLPDAFREMLPHATVATLSLLAVAGTVAVICYQRLLLRSTGALTLSQPFISQLLLLKRTYFALLVIVTSPPLLLFALCPRDTGGAWFWVIAIELLVTVLLYLRETLNLFISKKISILHWFLYLCIVEIFPLSLLWLTAGRQEW